MTSDAPSSKTPAFSAGVAVKGQWHPDYAEVLTPAALDFVARLARSFGERREALLERRKTVQASWRKGERPTSSLKRRPSGTATGRWLPCRRTSRTAASKSPAPWTG